jgi:hypothetical protein
MKANVGVEAGVHASFTLAPGKGKMLTLHPGSFNTSDYCTVHCWPQRRRGGQQKLFLPLPGIKPDDTVARAWPGH